MNKLIMKIALFSLPFIILAVLVFLVDPYEYFGYCSFAPQKNKLQTAEKLNYPLWKLINFKRKPSPNILLGDSRMSTFSTATIYKLTGQEYTNLAYGAGTLNEVCTTFWIAAETVNLKNVYIGLNLNLYNTSNSLNRVDGVKAILSNPLLYFVNSNVIHATFLLIKSRLVNMGAQRTDLISIEDPGIAKAAFWQQQLGDNTSRYHINYSKPSDKFLELQQISRYCKQNKINLVFIIPPTHEDLREKVRTFGLEKAESIFRKDLSSLGPVYDFDWLNDFTADKDNFADPYHVIKVHHNMLTEEIWGNKHKYAKFFTFIK